MSFYIHFYEKREANSFEEAKKYAELFNDIINCLSKEFPVFVRKEPEAFSTRDFDSNLEKHYAFTRFSVTTKEIAGRVGRINPTPDSFDPAKLNTFGV